MQNKLNEYLSRVTPLTESFIMKVKVSSGKEEEVMQRESEYFVDYSVSLYEYLSDALSRVLPGTKGLEMHIRIVPAKRTAKLNDGIPLVSKTADPYACLLHSFEISCLPNDSGNWDVENFKSKLYFKQDAGLTGKRRIPIAPDQAFAKGEQGLLNLIRVLNGIYQDLCKDSMQQC